MSEVGCWVTADAFVCVFASTSMLLLECASKGTLVSQMDRASS